MAQGNPKEKMSWKAFPKAKKKKGTLMTFQRQRKSKKKTTPDLPS
jgi:hypothetical protein